MFILLDPSTQYQNSLEQTQKLINNNLTSNVFRVKSKQIYFVLILRNIKSEVIINCNVMSPKTVSYSFVDKIVRKMKTTQIYNKFESFD